MTMFLIIDSLIGSRTSTTSVLPNIIDKAALPNMSAVFFSKIQDVRKTLPLFTVNGNVCAALPGFDSFRTLSCDEVKNVINRLPHKSRDQDHIPAACLRQCDDQLTPVITEMIDVSLNCSEFPELLKHALVRPLLKKCHHGLQYVMYADDILRHITRDGDQVPTGTFEECAVEIRNWMWINMLALNDRKTKVIHFSIKFYDQDHVIFMLATSAYLFLMLRVILGSWWTWQGPCRIIFQSYANHTVQIMKHK